jgi:hypothetical protein
MRLHGMSSNVCIVPNIGVVEVCNLFLELGPFSAGGSMGAKEAIWASLRLWSARRTYLVIKEVFG